MTATTTIPADWDITDPSTWCVSTTVDAHLGYHPTGMVMREYRTFSLCHDDLDCGDTEPTTEHAEWWADVLTAKLDADAAIAEASPEALDRIADLIAERNDSDDLETEAAVCRRIASALDA